MLKIISFSCEKKICLAFFSTYSICRQYGMVFNFQFIHLSRSLLFSTFCNVQFYMLYTVSSPSYLTSYSNLRINITLYNICYFCYSFLTLPMNPMIIIDTQQCCISTYFTLIDSYRFISCSFNLCKIDLFKFNYVCKINYD